MNKFLYRAGSENAATREAGIPAQRSRREFLSSVVALPLAGAVGWQSMPRAPQTRPMRTPQVVTFVGGAAGTWRVLRTEAVVGPPLPPVERVAVYEGERALQQNGAWTLRGVVGHLRYTTQREREQLAAVQAGLGRPDATYAAFIPIKKSEAWWGLAQDQRRAIFEEGSHHIRASMKYLPAIARRLHHSRDLGDPFDFLTWFEFAPQHAPLFDELVAMLRSTEEWKYVEHEVDIRLQRSK